MNQSTPPPVNRGKPESFRYYMDGSTGRIGATDGTGEHLSAVDAKGKATHDLEWNEITKLALRARNAADLIRLVDSPR